MCPLGERCSKVNRSRWPKSSTKSIVPVGNMCLYAHHYSELEFPETMMTKISALNQMKSKLSKNAETDEAAAKKPFRPANTFKDCSGCGKCQYCNFLKNSAEEQRKLLEKYSKNIHQNEDKNMTTFIDEMRDLKKKLNLDDNYFKKFGMLKKAAVLLFYNRENDAFDEIAKAVKIA